MPYISGLKTRNLLMMFPILGLQAPYPIERIAATSVASGTFQAWATSGFCSMRPRLTAPFFSPPGVLCPDGVGQTVFYASAASSTRYIILLFLRTIPKSVVSSL